MQVNLPEKSATEGFFLKSVLVPTKKKECAKHHENFKPSYISHASKVGIRILRKRLEKKVEEFYRRDQLRYPKRGTRYVIGVLRCLAKKSVECNQDLRV